MKIISPSFEILSSVAPEVILKNLEAYGRVCYKSENKATPASTDPFIRKLIKSGHESVIEHEKITVRIICSRSVTHEIIRHRIASYTQESTRYCNYAQERFGNELTFVKPCFWAYDSAAYSIWLKQMQSIEDNYLALIAASATPEQASSILPSSLKSEIIVSMNLREWRHFFKLRTSKRAHPQMREISIPLLCAMQNLLPAVFDDITATEEAYDNAPNQCQCHKINR